METEKHWSLTSPRCTHYTLAFDPNWGDGCWIQRVMGLDSDEVLFKYVETGTLKGLGEMVWFDPEGHRIGGGDAWVPTGPQYDPHARIDVSGLDRAYIHVFRSDHTKIVEIPLDPLLKPGADLRALAIWAVSLLIGMGVDPHNDAADKLTATVEAWDQAVAATKEKRS